MVPCKLISSGFISPSFSAGQCQKKEEKKNTKFELEKKIKISSLVAIDNFLWGIILAKRWPKNPIHMRDYEKKGIVIVIENHDRACDIKKGY